MSKESKPCWRCGATADVSTDPFGERRARCSDVRCPVYCDWMRLNDWNTRKVEDALCAELARKDELIKRLNTLVDVHARYKFIGQMEGDAEASAKLKAARARVEKAEETVKIFAEQLVRGNLAIINDCLELAAQEATKREAG